MSSIEQEVVSMKFDGNEFLSGVQKSLDALDKLNNKLKLTDGAKGLSDVGAAAESQASHLGRIGSAVETIGGKFKAMGVVGLAALSTITTQAVLAGESLVKSFSFGPILDGFHEYETNLNSIQTILANTASAGTNLGDVNKALNELNHYADQTIYNFSEMARNIGTFTAAGVDLKTSVSSIKGLANLAALSGSNAEQAAGAMYQLSQAISSGKVSLEDWNSVVNAGMGGTVFQRALALNAEKMGTLKDGAVKLSGAMKNVTINGQSFRDSITATPGKQSWLTSGVLTQTLSQFTGDLSKAQLKAEGFNDAEIKAIQSQANMAKSAATQVKTLSQLLDTTREAIGSGWTQTWQTVFGDFGEAKTLFTNVSNTINGFVSASSNARNKVLSDWKALGGRTAIINAIGNAFNALISLMKPIKDAFREIFPPITGKQLADMSKSIESFTKNLQIGGTTANNIKRTFAGLFAILDIGWQIIKQVAKTILDLVGVATQGSGGILNFTGNIGDFLVALDNAIKKGEGLSNFFAGLGKFLAGPIELIKKLAGYLGHLFDGFDGGKAADKVIKTLAPLSQLGSAIGSIWSKLGKIMLAVWKVFQPLAMKVGTFFAGLGKMVQDAISGIGFDNILKSINTTLFAGVVLLIKKIVDKFTGAKDAAKGGGFFDSIKESFEALTGTLENMQKVLQATALLEIAAAVAILTVSLLELSKIDMKALGTALGAITVMFGQMIGTMVVLQKLITGGGAVKLPIIAAGLILLATAVNILASAVVKMADLDWQGLAKGLTGLVGALGALTGAAHLMPDGKKMLASSVGLIAMATGVRILVGAVTQLGGLSWEEIAKGLTGVAGILASLGLFTRLVEADKAGISSGAGLLILAAGVKVLASALSDLSKLSWSDMAHGLVAMAGGLGLIVAAINLMPPQSLLSAASILVVAASLSMISDALLKMGDMSWSEIAKGLAELAGALGIIVVALNAMDAALPGAAALIVTAGALSILGTTLSDMGGMSWSEIAKSLVELAGSLTIIALALTAMEAALPGAAALIVAAGALAILAPVLVVLGGMSLGEIVIALVALAGALTVIGVAAALLTPVIPSIVALGAGVALLGAALALAGAGVFLFATGLTLLAASGVAAAGAILGIVQTLLGGLPLIVQFVQNLLSALLDLVVAVAPKLGKAAVVVFNTLLDALAQVAPKLLDTGGKLLSALLNTLLKYVPRMTDTGLKLVTGILNGIAANMGRLTTAAGNVAVAFINGISKQLPRIINAGLNLIVNFVNGLANGIRSHTSAMQAAGRNLAFAIIDGMTGGLASGVSRVVGEAKNVASSALSAAKSVLGIHSPSKEFYKIGQQVNAGFVKGLTTGNKSDVDNAFKSLKDQLNDAMRDSTANAAALTEKLKKLQSARHKDNKAIAQTKAALAQANAEHAKEYKAYTLLNGGMTTSYNKLNTLGAQYTALTQKIKDATDAYNNAIKTRDDFNQQISDQFSTATAPDASESVSDYITALQKQVADTNTFANAVQQLRAMGLNDDAYKQLLQAGVTDLPFVQNLLSGGKGAIDQINALQKQLDTTASSLGKVASSQLYQAAVDSAAGLVKGLQNQQAAIQKQMDQIAASMVSSIKKALGIKSPSRVFAQVGEYSVQGLAKGLSDNTSVVTKSAEGVASTAVATMQKSLANLSKMTISEVDLQPTIRPVLDLTDVKKDAGQIGGMLNKATISTSGAYSNALSVAASVNDRNDSTSQPPEPRSVNFTQNNYSPKAISAADTYRQTNNQISKAKKVLQGGE